MVKLIWTDQAINDLNVIADYIAENSTTYAKLTVQKIFEKTLLLKQFPNAGRMVPEKNQQDIRELIEGNYRIIYQITPGVIYILTIYHSARILNI